MFTFFSLMQNKWEVNDSVWINSFGTIFYIIYFGLFLKYAHADDRKATLLKWVPPSAIYILLIIAIGLVTKSTIAVKWMYTLAGLVSA